MSRELEQARELVAAGNDKKALKRLWTVESTARSSKSEAEAFFDLVSQIHARSGGRVQRDAQMLLEIARSHVTRFRCRSDGRRDRQTPSVSSPRQRGIQASA